MLNSFLFVTSAVGFANLIIYSSLFERLRAFLSARSELLSELLSCMMCCGFWSGFIFSLFFGINPIIGGCSISLLASFYDLVKDYIIVATEKTIEDTEDVDG